MPAVQEKYYNSGQGQRGAGGAERQILQHGAADHSGCGKKQDGKDAPDQGAAAKGGETVEFPAVTRGSL